MASTLRASIWTGASPTAASAEGGIKFNREDSASGTTAIPIPTSTGTNFSWHKNLGLEVTSDGSTTISNKRIHRGSAPTTGLELSFVANSAYLQSAAADSDSGSAGATPTGYTDLTTSAQVYDAGSDASSSGAGNVCGDYVRVALAVSSTYAGGAGSAIALPDIVLTYDEA